LGIPPLAWLKLETAAPRAHLSRATNHAGDRPCIPRISRYRTTALRRRRCQIKKTANYNIPMSSGPVRIRNRETSRTRQCSRNRRTRAVSPRVRSRNRRNTISRRKSRLRCQDGSIATWPSSGIKRRSRFLFQAAGEMSRRLICNRAYSRRIYILPIVHHPMLGEGDKTMSLSEDVRSLLAARAATDPNASRLLEMFTRADEVLSESSPVRTGNVKIPIEIASRVHY